MGKLFFLMPCKDLAEIETNGIGNGTIHYSYNKTEVQRESKTPTKATQNFFVTLLYWSLNNSMVPTTSPLYKMISSKYTICESSDIVVKLEFNPETKEVAILDGCHRRIFLEKIFKGQIRVPTIAQAKKSNIYLKAYHEIYKNYGGQTFKDLPVIVQNTLNEYPIDIKSLYNSDKEVSKAAFLRDNTCRQVNKPDTYNAIYCDFYIWRIIVALNKSFEIDKYPKTIKFNKNISFDNPLTQETWENCKNKLSVKKGPARLDFIIRTIAIVTPECINDDDNWGKNNDDIRHSVLNFYSTKSEDKIKTMLRKTFKSLGKVAICLEDIRDEASTVYTTCTKLYLSLSKAQKAKFESFNIDIANDISDWLTKPDPTGTRTNFDMVSNSCSSWTRVISTTSGMKAIMNKYI